LLIGLVGWLADGGFGSGFFFPFFSVGVLRESWAWRRVRLLFGGSSKLLSEALRECGGGAAAVAEHVRCRWLSNSSPLPSQLESRSEVIVPSNNLVEIPRSFLD